MSFIVMPPEEIRSLEFGQIKEATQEFFFKSNGNCHTIKLNSLPHYLSALAYINNRNDPFDLYRQYLKVSWSPKKEYRPNKGRGSRRYLDKRVVRYKQMIDKVRANKISLAPPLINVWHNKYIITDGNHRLSIAAALNRSLKVRLVESDTFPWNHECSGNLPSEQNYNLPLALDFKNKNILYFGCELGDFLINSFDIFFIEGWDINPFNMHCALRHNVFNCVNASFHTLLLDKEIITKVKPDTIFLSASLRNKEAVKNFLKKQDSTLYVEIEKDQNLDKWLSDITYSKDKSIDYKSFSTQTNLVRCLKI